MESLFYLNLITPASLSDDLVNRQRVSCKVFSCAFLWNAVTLLQLFVHKCYLLHTGQILLVSLPISTLKLRWLLIRLTWVLHYNLPQDTSYICVTNYIGFINNQNSKPTNTNWAQQTEYNKFVHWSIWISTLYFNICLLYTSRWKTAKDPVVYFNEWITQ